MIKVVTGKERGKDGSVNNNNNNNVYAGDNNNNNDSNRQQFQEIEMWIRKKSKRCQKI
jgi:hypothetical protein